MRARLLKSANLALALGLIASCRGGRVETSFAYVPGGDPDRGRAAIGRYGCGSCHVIPGLRTANGLVGPPLTAFGARRFIAGALPNRPENLVRWIRDPQAIEPGTVMPVLGVSEADARDITAYLLTLE